MMKISVKDLKILALLGFLTLSAGIFSFKECYVKHIKIFLDKLLKFSKKGVKL